MLKWHISGRPVLNLYTAITLGKELVLNLNSLLCILKFEVSFVVYNFQKSETKIKKTWQIYDFFTRIVCEKGDSLKSNLKGDLI